MDNNEYAEIVRSMAKLMADVLYKKDQSDHSFKAKVVEVVNQSKYRVFHCGQSIPVASSIELKEGDYVWVCAPCNNWNSLFVVCKTK